MILVKLDRLTKRYHKHYVLDKVDLEINEGEFIMLTGENGAGKSTLLKLILGQINKTSGKIMVNTTKISYVPENFILPENIKVKVFLKAYLAYLKEEDNYDYYIDKFNLRIHEDKLIKYLSKGTRQKLALVIASANNPKLLILDEVVSGLDDYSKELIVGFIKEHLERNVTVILSTHFKELYEEIENKKIYVVGDGHVKLT